MEAQHQEEMPEPSEEDMSEPPKEEQGYASQLSEKAKKLGKENFRKFSYKAIQQRTWKLLDEYVPDFPKQVPLKLPTLKKIDLPKLKKAE